MNKEKKYHAFRITKNLWGSSEQEKNNGFKVIRNKNKQKTLITILQKKLSSTFYCQKHLDTIVYNQGKAFEYFFLDYLQRSEQLNSSLEISHYRPSPDQDRDDKIDLISEVKIGQKTISFGIQMTTLRSQLAQNKPEKKNFQKKKNDIQLKSLQRDEKIFSGKESNREPDLLGFMVVNGHLGEMIKKHKRIFKEAFKERQKNNFKEHGPSIHLPPRIYSEIKLIAKYYQHSLKECIKLNKGYPISKKTSNKSFYSHIQFDPQNQEYQHSFFEKDLLIVSFSFFLNKTFAHKVSLLA